jgi:hypothetical protein
MLGLSLAVKDICPSPHVYGSGKRNAISRHMHRPRHEHALFEFHVMIHAINDALLAIRIAVTSPRVAHCTCCNSSLVLAGLSALAVALERKILRAGSAPVVGKLGTLSWNRRIGVPRSGALAQ